MAVTETVFVPIWTIWTALVSAAALVAVLLWCLRRVRHSAALFRAVAEGASDGLVLMERDSKIIWTNEAYSRTMGYPHGDLVGRYPLEFALPPHEAIPAEKARAFRFDENDELYGKLQLRENKRKNGSLFMHEFSHAVIRLGGKSRFLLAGRDVSQRVAREKALMAADAKLKAQSRTDALTGLSNRFELRRRLERSIRCGAPFAVLQIDLNGMKRVNDTFGHLAGDHMIKHVAEVIREIAGDDWVCARVGGDEFTIILNDEASLQNAARAAEALTKAASGRFAFGAATLTADLCIGVAIWRRGLDLDKILHCADIALYDAKKTRTQPVVCYDEALATRHAAAEALEQDLRQAVAERRFSFHFQPIIDLETRQVEKFEMLIRWRHPERGWIPPDVFLPEVTRIGLMSGIDRLVVERAREVIEKLDEAGLFSVGLSINLSSEALVSDDLAEHLLWLADGKQLDPGRIALEILESTAITLGEDTLPVQRLGRLRDAGYSLFLDDFGMGYAGLAHLAALPTTGFKIDKSLSAMVETDDSSRLIVTTLVDLADKLGLEVVAEGVENMAQIKIIQMAGCRVFQGYAVARPLTLQRAITWTKHSQEGVTTRTAS